jgi:O-antigen/teichoic acid export membrane protein
MSLARRLAKNAAWLYGGEVISKIFQIILVIVLARHYGAEIFGHYTFAISFTIMFAMLVDLGINSLIIREVARDRKSASKYLTNVLLVKSVLGIVAFVLIFIVINLLGYPAELRFLVYAFGVYNILFQISEFLKSFFKAYELMHLDSLVRLTERVISTALALYMVYIGMSLMYVAYVFIVSAVLTMLIALVLVRKRIVGFTKGLSQPFMKKFLKKSLPFAISFALYTVYFRIDVVLINKMQGDLSTGIYTSALQLVEALLFVSILVSMAVFPLLSESYKSMKARALKIYAKTSKLLFLIGVPIVVGTLVLGDRFILLFFGNEYSDAGLILKFLMFFILFHFLNIFNTSTTFAMKRENALIKLLVAVLIIHVVMNIFLIHYHSINGAAWAKVVSEVIYYAGLIFIIRPAFTKETLSVLLKTVFVGVVLFVVLKSIEGLNLFWIILIAAVLYGASIFLLRVISKEDIVLLKEIIRR